MDLTPQERAGIARGIPLFLYAAGAAGMPLVAVVAAGKAPWWTLIASPLFAGMVAFGQRYREARGDANRAERVAAGDATAIKSSDVGSAEARAHEREHPAHAAEPEPEPVVRVPRSRVGGSSEGRL